MADAKLNLPLDALIKASKAERTRGGARGRGRGGMRGGRGGAAAAAASTGPVRRVPAAGGARRFQPYSRPPTRGERADADQWQHDKYEGGDDEEIAPVARRAARRLGATAVVGGTGPISARLSRPATARAGAKLTITNLHYNVTTEDLEELFGELGELSSVNLHYDRSGRSTGVADVVFVRRSDAQRALQKYNGVELDQRPMHITLEEPEQAAAAVVSGARAALRAEAPTRRIVVGHAPGTYAARVAQRRVQAAARGTTVRGRGAAGATVVAAATPRSKAKQPQTQRRAAKPAQPQDLDADLDAYMNPDAAPAAAASTGGKQQKGARGGRGQKAVPTADVLDADLDAYFKS